jgi:fanconi anemia group J protein
VNPVAVSSGWDWNNTNQIRMNFNAVSGLDDVKKYPVSGHLVAFPKAPYGVQLVLMDKLIKAIESSSNALLEAPTGCGKTLALLCGALAWQTKMKDAQAIEEAAEQATIQQLGMGGGTVS